MKTHQTYCDFKDYFRITSGLQNYLVTQQDTRYRLRDIVELLERGEHPPHTPTGRTFSVCINGIGEHPNLIAQHIILSLLPFHETSSPSETYWMIWASSGSSPSKKHRSRASADEEAKRLAKSNPGKTFVVLQAVDAFESVITEPQSVPLKAEPETVGALVGIGGYAAHCGIARKGGPI